MTTTVTIETHDWPVRVESVDQIVHEQGGSVTRKYEEVPPNSKVSFCVTQTRHLRIFELPLPVVAVEAPTEA